MAEINENLAETVVSPQHSDFFHGDVKGGLERMRKRLLDLTLRNKLLNYKYSKKGALRVVDELPDQLFDSFADGKEFFFKPVKRPPGWGKKTAAAQLDGFKETTAAEHALTLGINTSYDLPVPSAVADLELQKHSDREIQTLLYPEDLEALLRTMASSARLAIEETGTNMLYLAFGFLDWTDKEESSQTYSAPLIMLPVSLRRADADSQTKAYRYAVQHSGEDILANISLQEKLRQEFALALPDFKEEETPESYFAQVEQMLAHRPEWALRRHVTLTLLSFGKLLMYRDLDPKCWPDKKGPAGHARVREFFEGREQSTFDIAADYSIDSPPPGVRIPELVDEADSSQHSVLADAVAGKNLVVAGPPGTGKSQTITNLIGAALAAGQRILFVSEKLAALEVVRHRLEGLGLGSFCLELHSHKSKKKALLDDINTRIKQQHSFADPVKLNSKLKALKESKERLTKYVDLINQPFGALHQKLFDVIWSASVARRSMGALSVLLDPHRLQDATSATIDEIEALKQKVGAYSQHLSAAIAVERELQKHPWYGVTNDNLTFQDSAKLLLHVAHLIREIEALQAAIAGVETVIQEDVPWVGSSIQAAEGVVRAVSSLPSLDRVFGDLLGRLHENLTRDTIAEFAGWLERYTSVRSALVQSHGLIPEYDSITCTQLDAALRSVVLVAPGLRVVGEVADGIIVCETAAKRVEDALLALEEFRLSAGLELSADDAGIAAASTALEILTHCPSEGLDLRHEGLATENSGKVLERAISERQAWAERQRKLSERLDLGMSPRPGDLRAHVTATADAKWWSFMRGSYRAARRVYRAMQVGGAFTAAQMNADYRELLRLAEARARIESNEAYRLTCGIHFSGTDTPFADLYAVALWWAQARTALAAFGERGERLLQTLWRLPSNKLSALVANERSANPRSVRIQIGRQALLNLRETLGSRDSEGPDWSQIRTAVLAIASALRNAHTLFEAIALPAQVVLARSRDLVAALLDLCELRNRIQQSERAADALGPNFQGTATDQDALRQSLRLYDAIEGASLPLSVKIWLRHPDGVPRVERLKVACGTLQSGCASARLAADSFRKAGRVRFDLWFGAQNGFDSATLDVVLTRCRVAVSQGDKLAAWFDYLRSAENLARDNLDYLVKLAENAQLTPSELLKALEYVRSISLIDEAFRAYPELTVFAGLSQDELRKQFASLDRECIALYRRRAAALAANREVPVGNGYGPVSSLTEESLLHHEIGKLKRHIPLRSLMNRAGRALQALKPCFMMGPLSVAQYLEPGAIKFDLLIVDEASQLRPQDALGAIARVDQVVIVGDQMQLPPTSFFDHLGADDEEFDEDAAPIEDAESILDVATSLYRPARMLKWHYRSRHGSLIAFSNKEFYKNELVVFPSPAPRSKSLGVKFVSLPDGVFEGHRNRKEAERIVASAMRHMEARKAETLGIVAMNAPQRELIEELLQQALKNNPAAEAYINNPANPLEPLFVKNLENVQGDERDVIFISGTYGRNAQGHFYQRFGPINGPTGHRRLNVLFTRARKRVVLFSSMRADDIKVLPGSSRGINALKAYLHYAETGVLESALFSGREPDSDFEVEVANALRERGLEVVAQVGVAGYFLDLAVKHPDRIDAFILGIECDGASYHSSLSARDRDRLRQGVLEDLGWNIHRIWSTDWFKQPEREVERILARIQRARSAPDPEAVGAEDWQTPERDVLATLLQDDLDWVDEIAAQPFTEQQCRDELVLLREEIRVHDISIGQANSLLADDMIALMVKKKPTTRDDWMRKIPTSLRLEINGDHVVSYLQRILQLTNKLHG